MTCNVYARTWLRVPSPSASNRYSAFPALPRKWCGSSGSRSAPVPTTQYFIWMIFGEEEGADEFYSFLLVLATSHQFASPRHTQASDVRHRYGVAIEQWLWDVHLWKLTANNQSSEPNHRLSLVTLYFLPKIRQRAQVWTNQAHSQAHQAAMALSDRQATTIRKFVCKYPAYFGTSPPPPRPTLSSSSLFKQWYICMVVPNHVVVYDKDSAFMMSRCADSGSSIRPQQQIQQQYGGMFWLLFLRLYWSFPKHQKTHSLSQGNIFCTPQTTG